MEEEMISHQVEIDEFMSLEWKIPKVITPLELKAMMSKVNKLFNLSEVAITEKRLYHRKTLSEVPQETKVKKHRQKRKRNLDEKTSKKIEEFVNQGQRDVDMIYKFLKQNGFEIGKRKQVYHKIYNYDTKIGRKNGQQQTY